MTFGERLIGQLGRIVIAAELFVIFDDLYGRVVPDTADEEQVSRVTMIEVDDGIFLDTLGVVYPHRISP